MMNIGIDRHSDRPPSYKSSKDSTAVNDDHPPSYTSIMERVRIAKKESNNPFDFLKKLTMLSFNSIVLIVVVFFLSILPVSMVAIGAIYINDCPIEGYIPIWLIVFGSFGILSLAISSAFALWEYYKKKEDENYKLSGITKLKNLLDIFLFSWSIAGSFWIYGNYSMVDFTYKSGSNYCQRTCYLLAFSAITVYWVATGFMCICCVCFVPSVLALFCCTAKVGTSN